MKLPKMFRPNPPKPDWGWVQRQAQAESMGRGQRIAPAMVVEVTEDADKRVFANANVEPWFILQTEYGRLLVGYSHYETTSATDDNPLGDEFKVVRGRSDQSPLVALVYTPDGSQWEPIPGEALFVGVSCCPNDLNSSVIRSLAVQIAMLQSQVAR